MKQKVLRLAIFSCIILILTVELRDDPIAWLLWFVSGAACGITLICAVLAMEIEE